MRAMVTFWSLHSTKLQQSGTAPNFILPTHSQRLVRQPSDNAKLESVCLKREARSPVYQPDLSPNLQHRRRLGLCGIGECKQIQIMLPTDRQCGCTSAELSGTTRHKTLGTPLRQLLGAHLPGEVGCCKEFAARRDAHQRCPYRVHLGHHVGKELAVPQQCQCLQQTAKRSHKFQACRPRRVACMGSYGSDLKIKGAAFVGAQPIQLPNWASAQGMVCIRLAAASRQDTAIRTCRGVWAPLYWCMS